MLRRRRVQGFLSFIALIIYVHSLPHCSDQILQSFNVDVSNCHPTSLDSLAAPDPTPEVAVGQKHRSGCSGSPEAVVDHVGNGSRCRDLTANVLRSHLMQRIPIIFRDIPHNQRFAVLWLIRVNLLAMMILSFHKFQYVGFTWGNKTRENSRFRFYLTTSSSRVRSTISFVIISFLQDTQLFNSFAHYLKSVMILHHSLFEIVLVRFPSPRYLPPKFPPSSRLGAIATTS